MKDIHLSKAALEPWAIMPQSLGVIVDVVTRHFSGDKLDAEEVQMRIHGAKKPAERIHGEIAVLPLFGTIFPRANLFTEVSGATSAEIFGQRFDELVADPKVGAIVLDVDSPGGQAPGVEELSTKIFQARGKKPIIAVANHLMASAAYWIGTAADELVVSPSGEVGSIGVYSIHQDVSEALAREGVRMTIIKEGKYKAVGNQYEPLTEEAHAVLQERVSEVYAQFIEAVARNRGVDGDDVRNGFGEGRTVGAKQAVKMGMADRVATLDETVERLQTKGWRSPREMAKDLTPEEDPTPALPISGEMERVSEEDVSGEAAVSDAVESVSDEAEKLSNFLLIFGPKKGGD